MNSAERMTRELARLYRIEVAILRLRKAQEREGGKVGAMGVAWYAETCAAMKELDEALAQERRR